MEYGRYVVARCRGGVSGASGLPAPHSSRHCTACSPVGGVLNSLHRHGGIVVQGQMEHRRKAVCSQLCISFGGNSNILNSHRLLCTQFVHRVCRFVTRPPCWLFIHNCNASNKHWVNRPRLINASVCRQCYAEQDIWWWIVSA